MVALLDLPDELLEVIVAHLIRGILNDLWDDYSVFSGPTCPSLPNKPFGPSEFAVPRLVCQRLRRLVNKYVFRSVDITICSDVVAKDGPAPARAGAHPDCGKPSEGPAMRDSDQECWHLLRPDSLLTTYVKEANLTLCYASCSSGSEVDAERVSRMAEQTDLVLESLRVHVRMLRLHVDRDDHSGQDLPSIPHALLSSLYGFPSLRALCLMDASVYSFLPAIAINAPLLREVLLIDRQLQSGDTCVQALQAAHGARPDKPLRVPGAGTWSTLQVICLEPSFDLMQPFFECISFATQSLIFEYMGMPEARSAWSNALSDLLATALSHSTFETLVLDLGFRRRSSQQDQQSISAMGDGLYRQMQEALGPDKAGITISVV